MLFRFSQAATDSLEFYIWLWDFLVCTLLLLLHGRSFHIRHSEYDFQISPEEYQTHFYSYRVLIAYMTGK